MRMTRHAEKRAAQRSIPAAVVQSIYDYGAPYASRGATALRLDRKAFDLAEDDMPLRDVQRLRRFSTVYLVSNGEKVITVARSSRRHLQ